LEGECEGREVLGQLEIPITNVVEFVAANCGDFELISGLGPIDVHDFSLYPKIKVTIRLDIFAFSYEGQIITYTIELENTGLLPLTKVLSFTRII